MKLKLIASLFVIAPAFAATAQTEPADAAAPAPSAPPRIEPSVLDPLYQEQPSARWLATPGPSVLAPEPEPAVRLVVVADVDDTLRRTNVRSRLDSLGAILDSDTMFSGMSRLLVRFACAEATAGPERDACWREPKAEAVGARRIRYLSGAPESWLGGSVRRFLDFNGFPEGAVELRQGTVSLEDVAQFKTRRLLAIAARYPNARIAALGDNGDWDVSVFRDVSARLGQRFLPFVHEVHSYRSQEAASAGAFPTWVTAADLAREFARAGLSDQDDVSAITAIVSDDLRKKPETVLPEWLLCPNVPTNPAFRDVPAALPPAVDAAFRSLLGFVISHCLQSEAMANN